ncbi:FkbM family methyltransferase [Aliarcobacter butzleri]
MSGEKLIKFISNYEKQPNLNETTNKYINLFLEDIKNNKILLENISSCACGSNDLELIETKDRFGLAFNSLICNKCGLINTNPRIKEESLEYYYKNFYHHLTFGTESLKNKKSIFSNEQGNKIFNLVKDYLEDKEELQVLEIGCGTGSVLVEFQNEADKHNIKTSIFGTEYNDECIEICTKNNINIISNNLENTLYSELKYDLIILSHVFEHFIDLGKNLKFISELLKENGILYIEVPGVQALHKSNYYKSNFIKYLTYAHIYNFSLDSLKTILNQNRFICLYGNENVESIFKKGSAEILFQGSNSNKRYLQDLSEHEAFKEKNLLAINQREKDYNDFLVVKNSYKKVLANSNSIYLLYPSFNNIDDLNDILYKLSFALPDTNNISIIVPIDKNLELDIDNFEKNTYIKFIKDSEVDLYIEDNTILIHSMDKVEDLSLFKDSKEFEIIDKNYFSTVEPSTLTTLFFKSLDIESKKIYEKICEENFINFKIKNIDKKQAFCFTTGPSFDTYKSFNFPKNSLNIICNSIVKNNEFLDYIKNVDLITFGDPVFHFGSSKYAELFREDVLKIVENSETYIAIPDINVPLMIFHYPKLKHRIIGIKSDFKYNFPEAGKLFIKGTNNILTKLMIPMASSICNTIFIMGADGRKPNENYFWQHSQNAQYTDLMETVFIAHPSFFRDRVYTDYYKEHCEDLEKLIEYGESLGKVYFSITKSYIPAFEKRFIDFNISKKELIQNIELVRAKNIKSKGDISTLYSNDEINLDFSIKINLLFSHIEKIKKSEAKIAIYGNGLIGNLIAKEIKEQLVVICDQNPNSMSEFCKTCLPSELESFNFDFLLISVLGRESTITKNLNIDKNKILTINLTKNGIDSFNLAILDKNCKEFLDNNLIGPYSRESSLIIDETKIIYKYFNSSCGTMIDVGAHFGSSAELFLKNDWKVYCYEPDPNNRKKLISNLENYSNKIIFDKAISNKINESVIFYDSEESTGISSLLPFNDYHKKICEVQTSTLKKEIEENNIENIDFLKIDTEGYDFMVLQGLSFDIIKPLIIECEFEDLKTNKLGYTVKDMINFLQSKNYIVYVSEWHPIIRYGIQHQWKRFFKYDNQDIDSKGWGNLIAFYKEVDEDFLVRIIKESLNLK